MRFDCQQTAKRSSQGSVPGTRWQTRKGHEPCGLSYSSIDGIDFVGSE